MVQPLIGIGDVLTRQTFSNRMIYNSQETTLDSFDVIIFKNRVKNFFLKPFNDNAGVFL